MYVCHRGAPRRVGMYDLQHYGAVITDFCHAIYERMNGEIVARTKTARGFNLAHDPERDRLLGGGCPALVRMCVMHHNFFRPHSGLGGKTPAEAVGISIGGDDKFITMIWNAAARAKADTKVGGGAAGAA